MTQDPDHNPAADAEPALPPDAEAAYRHYLPAAMALPAEAVLPLRCDANIAAGNVRTGVGHVLPLRAELEKHLPKLQWDNMALLPAQADAMLFAAAAVLRNLPSTGEIKALLAHAAVLRDEQLAAAEALAKKGKLPAAQVDAIRAGRGPIDLATDCVQLAGLFREFAAQVAGLHPIGAAEIDDAAATGTRLLSVLNPKGYKAGVRPETEADRAADRRDRLWTLLATGYDDVRRAAFYKWLDAAKGYAPQMGSRKVERKAAVEPGKPQ